MIFEIQPADADFFTSGSPYLRTDTFGMSYIGTKDVTDIGVLTMLGGVQPKEERILSLTRINKKFSDYAIESLKNSFDVYVEYVLENFKKPSLTLLLSYHIMSHNVEGRTPKLNKDTEVVYFYFVKFFSLFSRIYTRTLNDITKYDIIVDDEFIDSIFMKTDYENLLNELVKLSFNIIDYNTETYIGFNYVGELKKFYIGLIDKIKEKIKEKTEKSIDWY